MKFPSLGSAHACDSPPPFATSVGWFFSIGRRAGIGGLLGAWLSVAFIGDQLPWNLASALLGATVVLCLARRSGSI